MRFRIGPECRGPAAAAVVLALVLLPASPASPQAAPQEHGEVHHHAAAAHAVQIPPSVREEHEAIHATLVEALSAPDPVGAAARSLAQVLHPHFVREEQVALPPLGLLAPLASGETPAGMREALAMADTLRRELPQMLEEHVRIKAAVENLRQAARTAGSDRFEKLAESLALHARTEEDVFYPAAILVGEIIRARIERK